jgi:hypothetical protein
MADGDNLAKTTKAIPLTAPQGRGARMTRGAIGTATEAPEPTATNPTVPAGASTEEANRGQITTSDELEVPGAPGRQKGMVTAKGTITPPLPDRLQRIKAHSSARIREAQKAQTLQDMAASGATQEQMQLWAQINDQDAEEGQRLYDDHFVRARDNIRGLQDKVDQARALKINPYNWHESIGRGGRVAAAFAALTGGFAAGKSNPNSALKMMDAAIERDISAQKVNIQNVYEGLKLQRGLNVDEARLFNEQMNAMNEIRAVNYAAILGRIQAAKQNAITESHYLAYQTAEDHYNLKLVEAFAAAQKEYLRLEVDGELRNSAHLQALQTQMAQYQQQLGGAPAATSAPAAPSGRQLEAPRAGSAALGRGRPPRRVGGTPTGQEPEAQAQREGIPAGAVAQDETGQYLDASGNVVQPAQKAEPRAPFRRPEPVSPEEGQMRSSLIRDIVQSGQAPAHIGKFESFAQAAFAEKNLGTNTPGITKWGEAIADINAGRPIRNGGVTGTADARVIASRAPMPDPSQYRNAQHSDGRASTAYQVARDIVERGERFPEIYERPSSFNGERNTITAGGKTYRVKAGARDAKTYERVRENVVKKEALTSALYNMSDLVRRKGLQGIFTDEGGINIPGLTTGDPGADLIGQNVITQAMNYIKTHDPTARISDKDLEVGERAATPFMSSWGKFLDLVQSLDGVPENNTLRQKVTRFLAKLGVEAARIAWTEIENEVVPDYNTQQEMLKRTQEVENFVYGNVD